MPPLLGYPGVPGLPQRVEDRLFTNTPGAAPSPNLFVAVTIATKVSDALYFLGIQDGRG